MFNFISDENSAGNQSLSNALRKSTKMASAGLLQAVVVNLISSINETILV